MIWTNAVGMVQGHFSSLDNWQYTLNKNNSQRKGNCITNFLNADRPTHEIQWKQTPIIPKETIFRKFEGCTGAPPKSKQLPPSNRCEIYHNRLKCSLLSMLKDLLTTESHCFQTLNIPTVRMGDGFGWISNHRLSPGNWAAGSHHGWSALHDTCWRPLVVMLEAPTD